MNAIGGIRADTNQVGTREGVQGQVAIAVLGKALDIQAASAAALIQSLPAVQSSAALGTLVDAYA